MQLDREARSDVEAYKASVTPSMSTREANWEAIAGRALRGEGPEWADDPDVVPRRRRPTGWLLGGALAVAAAVVVTLVQGGKLLSRDEASSAPASASYEVEPRSPALEPSETSVRERPGHGRTPGLPVESAEDPPSETSEVEDTEVEATEVEATEVETREAPRKAPPASAKKRSTPDVDSEPDPEPRDPLASVRVESSLVGRARAALRDDDPETALRLLDQHVQRFPSGELEQEREVLRISALCEAGRDAEAKEVARAFRAAFSGSPLLGHLGSTCAGAR